jgi:alkanesulfonate monooxygenase SsuD/methylene tetrahydromethanopterin reductase-like flavin-dependent oxidoreductase (luciferase family)
MELGVALPNGGASPSVDDVLRVADAAAALGFDSVWTSEHVIVPNDAPPSFRQSLDSLQTLAWVGARHPNLGLGTSVLILPLHNPFILARRVAALQQFSGGRFRLGVGVGWNKEEFEFLGAPFEGRGARADEQLRVMRSLWSGDFENGSFGPLPDPPPEIWVGGNAKASLRRAREVGGAWHPIRVGAADVREALADWPGGKVTTRMPVEDLGEAADKLAAMREAGLSGAVLYFEGGVEAMEKFAADAAPSLRAA